MSRIPLDKLGWIRRGIGLFIVLTGVSLAVYYLRRDIHELFNLKLRLNLQFLLISFCLESAGLAIAIYIWGDILNSFVSDVSPTDNLRAYIYSSLSWLIPGGIWNIIARAALYPANKANPEQVASATIAERYITGLSALMIFGFISVFQPSIDIVQRPILALVLCSLGLIFIHPLIFNGIYQILVNFSGQRLHYFRASFTFRDVIKWLFAEVFVLVLGGIALFFLFASVSGASFSTLTNIIAAWTGSSGAANLLFWLPGSIVFREGIFITILAQQINASEAILFAILVRIWTTFGFLLLAGLTWILLDSPLAKRLHV